MAALTVRWTSADECCRVAELQKDLKAIHRCPSGFRVTFAGKKLYFVLLSFGRLTVSGCYIHQREDDAFAWCEHSYDEARSYVGGVNNCLSSLETLFWLSEGVKGQLRAISDFKNLSEWTEKGGQKGREVLKHPSRLGYDFILALQMEWARQTKKSNSIKWRWAL